MTPEERERRRYARAEAREKQQRLAFWDTIPPGERERLCVWFAQQFGFGSTEKTDKPTKPNKASTVAPKALITDGMTIDQIIKTEVIHKSPPLSPRISKEKPPWWKR